MGVTLMEFGNYMRKGVMFTMKGSYSLVSNHPFLVCVVCFLIHISRSFPLMFSLLVSASPVVICTAVLLGTLLFYGQRNIHESEIEMKTKSEAVPLKRRLSLDSNFSEQNERHFVERCGESKRDDNVESSLLPNKLSEIRVGGGSVDGSSKGRRSFGVESDNSEENGAFSDPLHEERERERERERLGDGEVMADHYAIISKVIGELLDSESDQEKSEGDSCDSERGHRGEGHEDEEDDESGSDRGESSSPDDTSIEDIMPTMLDELHPLLDEEGAQPPRTSRDASEAALSEHSPRSSVSSIESVETDNQESEAADDDDDDDDDEAQDEKEDHTKSVITWTEEDQKNLMEVGNSEIERNRRLERILRRRKNRSMVPEINLMEFQNPDFQFQIAPISTARQNPFDLPQDSVPGSAPSVMLQRKNPFDMPFDDEDDPSEVAEESQEELKPSLSRPFLRRRDNFTARPSIFSPNRQQRLPVKLRPFFVAEQTVVDESSYSPFKRQSSDNSSVHETESVASVEYLEDEKLEEGDDLSGDQDQDQVSNDQETADTTASTNNAPSRDPVYDTDTSPTAVGKNYSSSSSFADAHAELDKRAHGDNHSSSSRCSEYSVDDGESDGASYHEMQVADTSSTASTSMEENELVGTGTTPHNPEQGEE